MKKLWIIVIGLGALIFGLSGSVPISENPVWPDDRRPVMRDYNPDDYCWMK